MYVMYSNIQNNWYDPLIWSKIVIVYVRMDFLLKHKCEFLVIYFLPPFKNIMHIRSSVIDSDVYCVIFMQNKQLIESLGIRYKCV